MEISTIVGSAAGLAIMLGYLPQTIQTIRTRKTDDIAFGTFMLIAVGSLLFAVQGVMTSNMPLFVTNALSFVMSSIIFVIKVINDTRKRRG